jgi:hypothetical protein
MKSWSEFFNMVVKMRAAQKAYFVCKDWAQKERRLNEARDLERRVDAAIKEHTARIENARSPGLFEEEA